MKYFFNIFVQRNRVVAVAAALGLTLLTAAYVSAAQATDRSIQLSSSSKGATSVSYKVKFTPVANAGAFVVDFCSNSPVIGEACTSPAGFSATTAASTTSGFTTVNALDANTIVVTGSMTAATPVTVDVTGIKNPDASGALYARIVSYATQANANAYVSTNLGSGKVDEGGVAIAITDTIGVSGAVLEAMTFCVSKVAPTANCGGTTNPAVKLGDTIGNNTVLSSTVLSSDTIYTQISTNASSGAVINLKSNALSCGGLLRAGSPAACDITPTTDGIVAGDPEFGVRTATATNATGATNAVGVLQATGTYNPTTYTMGYVAGNATGVTSTYGDPFLNTNNLPVNNKNMAITFGASASNTTPAGFYSADMSMIATGKF